MKSSSDPDCHPGIDAFRRLVHGNSTPDETRDIVRHLLVGCGRCLAMAEDARGGLRPMEPVATYDDIFERLERRLVEGARSLERERETAPELYSELLAHEAVEGLIQVQSTRRYASLALCELLLQKSRDLVSESPEASHRAAELAVTVAEQLDLDLYGAPVVQDLRAIAWAYLANSRRVHADLRSAERSMELAARLLDEGSGDPLARAELLTLQASLRSYGGRFEEALGLLNRVAAIYRRIGDRHLFGRTLIKKGTVFGNYGAADCAVRLIRRGIDLIEPTREPRLLVAATHNLIWFLKEEGKTGLAAACLDGTRRLYEQAGDRQHLGRLRWLEGKLASSLAGAEEALLDARAGLAREGLSYEAALASMDLAVLYAGERRGVDMRRQVEQMLPLFRSGDMYRETVVALSCFQQSGGQNETNLLSELGTYIRRAREEKNPPALAAAF